MDSTPGMVALTACLIFGILEGEKGFKLIIGPSR